MRLVIHHDGRVLAHEYGEADRVLDKHDPFALAQVFRALVELEEGLTSAQLSGRFGRGTCFCRARRG